MRRRPAGARKVLRAAALTYVAALLMSLLQLLRFVLIFLEPGRREPGRRPPMSPQCPGDRPGRAGPLPDAGRPGRMRPWDRQLRQRTA